MLSDKMDLMFDLSGLNPQKDVFESSKKDVLKFLKIIGADSRYISYTPDKLYINNLRFSKFSRKRQDTFTKHFPDIEVVRNTLFQKICSKSAKTLSSQIKPNSRILMCENNYLIDLILEPYTRKYGVKLVYEGEYDLKVNPIILDDEVNNIFESIFKGEALNLKHYDNEIYPLINVSLDWINSFLEMDGKQTVKKENKDELANSFSRFLDDTTPQYKENVLKATQFVLDNSLFEF